VEVSEVCRREGINPTMFYTWKKKLMASATQVFDEKPKKQDVERERRVRSLPHSLRMVGPAAACHPGCPDRSLGTNELQG
jgi:transposase-like protein